MTQLSEANAFRRFLRQFLTDFLEIWHRTFPSNVLTPLTNSRNYIQNFKS